MVIKLYKEKKVFEYIKLYTFSISIDQKSSIFYIIIIKYIF